MIPLRVIALLLPLCSLAPWANAETCTITEKLAFRTILLAPQFL